MLGRPSTYSPEYASRVEDYLALCKDVLDPETKALRVKVPTIEGFARFIGVHKDTLYEWEKKEADISDALERIRTEQLERVLNSGLAGTYNPTIAKLILSANHGMKERSDVTTDDKELPAPIIPLDALRGNKRAPGDSKPGAEG